MTLTPLARPLASVLLRLLALLAVGLPLLLVGLPGDDGLGSGLLALTWFVAVGAGWGLLDGVRLPARHLLVWIPVAVLNAAILTLASAVAFPSPGRSVAVPDLLDPLEIALVVVPALVTGGLGALGRRSTASR